MADGQKALDKLTAERYGVVLADLKMPKLDGLTLLQELQLKRWLITLTVVGMSFVLLGLQGWLAWRLLRPDVRSRFH